MKDLIEAIVNRKTYSPANVSVFVRPEPCHCPLEGMYIPCIALWRDGRIVWSHNVTGEGPPYLQGRVDPDTVRRLLEDLRSLDLSLGDDFLRGGRPSEESFSAITIRDGRYCREDVAHRKYLRETLARRGDAEAATAAASQPAVSLGMQRESRYDRWMRARRMIQALVPAGGEPLDESEIQVMSVLRLPEADRSDPDTPNAPAKAGSN